MQIIRFSLFVLLGFSMSFSAGNVLAKSIQGKEKFPDKKNAKTFNVNGVPFFIDLKFSASVRGDDTLKCGVYLFKLKCAADAPCDLERISLNECVTDKEGITSFSPKVDQWNTWSKFLDVKQLSNNQLELVAYQAFERLLPAKIILSFNTEKPYFKILKSFEASDFIDGLLWPNISTRIEYVPIQGDQMKQLDCPVFLPGIRP